MQDFDLLPAGSDVNKDDLGLKDKARDLRCQGQISSAFYIVFNVHVL